MMMMMVVVMMMMMIMMIMIMAGRLGSVARVFEGVYGVRDDDYIAWREISNFDFFTRLQLNPDATSADNRRKFYEISRGVQRAAVSGPNEPHKKCPARPYCEPSRASLLCNVTTSSSRGVSMSSSYRSRAAARATTPLSGWQPASANY